MASLPPKAPSEDTLPLSKRLAFQLGFPLFLFIGVTTIIVSLLIAYAYTRDRLQADAVPVQIAGTTAELATAFFDSVSFGLSLASLSVKNTELASLTNEIDAVVESHPSIAEIAIVDTAGTVLYDARKASFVSIEQPGDIAKHSAVIGAVNTEGFYASSIRTGGSVPYMVWAFVVEDSAQNSALLVALIDMSGFANILASAAEGNDALVYAINPSGEILSASGEYQEGATTEAHTITDTTERYRGLLGERVSAFKNEIPLLGWSVVAEVPLKLLTNETRRNLLILLILIVFYITLGSFLFMILRKNLSEPLAEFVDTTKLIAAGEYKTRIAVAVENEFSLLATMFNTMAQSIDTQTTTIVEQLKTTVADLNRGTKLIMKRDEELSKANTLLRSLDNAKSEFVTIAAHQLRTPLSALSWAQQMLRQGDFGPLNDQQKVLVKQSEESIQRMSALIQDLLNADHLEFGEVRYNFSAANLDNLIESVVKELTPMAQEKSITLLYKKGEAPYPVTADERQLREVFLNLINNALKYTPAHGMVSCRTSYQDHAVRITIADSGIGIPKENHPRVFEKFMRMDNAKKVDANGSGLGLFIVKKIIDAHKGKIWFNSDEGKGTTFFIELPKTAPINTRQQFKANQAFL